MRKIKAIWDLTRAEHGLMYGFGVLIGIVIAGGSSYETAILGFLVAVFIQAGTFALNDYCDLDSDIANRREDRPLVRGELRKEVALLIAYCATALGIISAIFLAIIMDNFILLLVALTLSALGIFYDLQMKALLAISNVYIAFTMAVPFIFGGLISEPGGIKMPILILSSIAFLAGFGREVMKDIADVKGDALRDIRSVARMYGVEKAKAITVLSYSIAVILSAIPFFLLNTPYFFNPVYLLLILTADAVFVHVCLELRPFRKRFDLKIISVIQKDEVNYIYLRKETLIAIAIGLAAFICGALISF
jgi:geranylgeranylglycerol-phosphate geranylgeranyltransferase